MTEIMLLPTVYVKELQLTILFMLRVEFWHKSNCFDSFDRDDSLYILIERVGKCSAKLTHINRKKLISFVFESAGCSPLRAEGFSCSLDVLYGGQGISKLKFL